VDVCLVDVILGCGDSDNWRSNVYDFYMGAEIAQSLQRRAGWPEFDFRKEQGIFLYSTASRPAFGPTQLPIQWATVRLSWA
jgi:hypothetical protein